MTVVDQFQFTASQRDLVADLVKVPHKLRAFAIQATHGDIDFLQAAKDFFDLASDDQRRQMHITLTRKPVPTFVGHAVKYPKRSWNA